VVESGEEVAQAGREDQQRGHEDRAGTERQHDGCDGCDDQRERTTRGEYSKI
jgi:hypothetical protein